MTELSHEAIAFARDVMQLPPGQRTVIREFMELAATDQGELCFKALNRILGRYYRGEITDSDKWVLIEKRVRHCKAKIEEVHHG